MKEIKAQTEIKTDKFTKLLKVPKYYVAFRIYKKRNDMPGMYRNLKRLTTTFKDSPAYQKQLAELSFQRKMWKQSLHHINAAISLSDKDKSIHFYKHKANCFSKLGESAKAAYNLNVYLQGTPDDSQAWFQQAEEYFRLQNWQACANSLESYLKLKKEDPIASYQLGECNFKLNNTKLAELNYQQATKNLDYKLKNQSLAFAHYKFGLMQLMNNKATKASESFSEALKEDQELKSWYFGIGVFHEHFKQWTYALEAYENQLTKNSNNAELLFKIASMLDGINQPQQALKYYEEALKLDKVKSPWHFALANCYEQLQDYKNAARWYKSAIDRQEKHRHENYRRLGFVLSKLGKNKEAIIAYKEAELFNKYQIKKTEVYKNDITKISTRYAISYEHYPVMNNMIFYESLSGGRIMGNPYAVFEQVYGDSNFKNYIHVWVISSFSVIPNELKNKDNIIFVKKNSDAYLKYISSAKYLINNNTFSDYFVRKPNQIYLQTSHGIFYKTVGKDSAGTSLGVAGGTRNLLQATHIIVPNDFMAEKQPKSYSIKDIHSGQIAKIGYPRIDITINASKEFKQQLLAKLKLNSKKKTVFYAPTWRGSDKTQNRFDSNKLISDLNMLATLDANVIFRGHTVTNSLLKDVTFPKNIILPTPDIQTNEILSIADVLISDYSSVFFDFIPTERPIVHYLYDVEEYTKERGLNLTEDELPGIIAKTSNQLFEGVKNSLKHDEPSSHYLKAKKRFCTYDDGKSSERVARWFFYGDSTGIDLVDSDKKNKSYLYLGGALSDKAKIPELVTELNELKQSNYTVSLMLEKSLTKDDEKLSILKRLNPDINLLAYAGKIPAMPEEIKAIRYFNKYGEFTNDKMYKDYKQAFKREARRLFGDSTFDKIINFEEDSEFWNGLSDTVISRSSANQL